MIKNGKIQQICFYPAADIKFAFKKAEDVKSEHDELKRLREFYLNMKFFYSFAQTAESEQVLEIEGKELEAFYAYARKGLETEYKTTIFIRN